MKNIFDAPSPRLIGHRGFTPAAPENSLPAFEAAGQLGLWAIETDIHMTSDGVLVCCHNPDTSECFDHQLTIAESTFAELRKLRIIRGRQISAPMQIPAFTEYLAICKQYGAVPFIESKVPIVDQILTILKQQNMIHSSILSSTDLSHLEECRRLNRQIFIHHIFSTPETMLKIAELKNGGVSYNYPDPSLAPPELLILTHANGVRVCLRAADTPAHVRQMQSLNLDYIPTNCLTPSWE